MEEKELEKLLADSAMFDCETGVRLAHKYGAPLTPTIIKYVAINKNLNLCKWIVEDLAFDSETKKAYYEILEEEASCRAAFAVRHSEHDVAINLWDFLNYLLSKKIVRVNQVLKRSARYGNHSATEWALVNGANDYEQALAGSEWNGHFYCTKLIETCQENAQQRPEPRLVEEIIKEFIKDALDDPFESFDWVKPFLIK